MKNDEAGPPDPPGLWLDHFDQDWACVPPIETVEEFAVWLEKLSRSKQVRDTQNPATEMFLECTSAFIEARRGRDDGRKGLPSEEPSWRLFAYLLDAGLIYE